MKEKKTTQFGNLVKHMGTITENRHYKYKLFMKIWILNVDTGFYAVIVYNFLIWKILFRNVKLSVYLLIYLSGFRLVSTAAETILPVVQEDIKHTH